MRTGVCICDSGWSGSSCQVSVTDVTLGAVLGTLGVFAVAVAAFAVYCFCCGGRGCCQSCRCSPRDATRAANGDNRECPVQRSTPQLLFTYFKVELSNCSVFLGHHMQDMMLLGIHPHASCGTCLAELPSSKRISTCLLLKKRRRQQHCTYLCPARAE